MTCRLQKNSDGSFDVIVDYNKDDPEFSAELFSGGLLNGAAESAGEFIRRQAENVKINAVKILVAGVLVTTIPFSAFASANAAQVDRYSQAYLYLGSDSQQIEYVKSTGNSLDVVSPSWFDIKADGTLHAKYVSPKLMDAMRKDGIKVVPFLSNHWDRAAGIEFLKNREHYSTVLANHVRDNGLDGLNIDIENVTHEQRGQYTDFVRLLRQKIPAHKEISVAVAANPKGWTAGWHGSYDYAGLAKYADHLFIMAYDESYQGGPAGPVASIGFAEESIKYALKHAPASKLVLGLPLFGRMWSDTGFNGQGVYLNLAQSLVSAYNAKIVFDTVSQSPKAEFTVRAGDPQLTVLGKPVIPGKYTLWMENKQSIEKKLELVKKYNLKGAGSWALGQETADIWKDYTAVLNNIKVPAGTDAPNKTTAPGTGTSGTTAAAKPAPTSPVKKPEAVVPAVKPEESPRPRNDNEAIRDSEQADASSGTENAAEVNGTVEIPSNLTEQAEVAYQSNVYEKPGGNVIGKIAAGAVILITGLTVTGYYRFVWKKKHAYINKSDVNHIE